MTPRTRLGAALVALAACGGGGSTGSAASVRRPADLPADREIAYGDPWAQPPRRPIPPGWVEHRADNPDASVAYRWVDILLEAAARDIERVHAPRPTILSRQMAVPLMAMYEAWAAYDARAVGTRLAGRLRRPAAERTPGNKAAAISYAMHRALGAMVDDAAWLDAQLRGLGYDPADASTDLATPQGIGCAAATAVLEARRHDGANQLGDEPGGNGAPYSDTTHYQPVNPPGELRDPDRWQPIAFDDGKGGVVRPGFLTPHWSRVAPLALDRADQFRPPPPPRVGSPELRREVAQLIGFNGGLSLEQKAIVEFMRDGPRSTGQSGHWLRFAQDISRRDPTLSGTAEMAGLSRLLGGYHIQSDNREGLRLGRAVADYSWRRYQAYFDGTAAAASR